MFAFIFIMLVLVLGGIVVLFSICVRWVVVQEARIVAFKYLGRFAYCAMEFADNHFDSSGSIVSGPGPNGHGDCWCIWRWSGGLVFYIWPLVKPAKYADYNDPEDGFGEGIFVRLNDVASNPYTSVAETTELGSESGSVGVNVKFTSKMRVVNPYLFLFKSPRDVIKEAVEDRQDGVLRAWVFSGNRKHAQAAKGNGAQLWTELGSLGLLPTFEEAKKDWGLEIVPNSIVVKEVGFDPAYQAALQAQSQAKLVAQAEVAKISAIDRAMDQWVKGQAKTTKKTIAEALAALKTDGSWQRQRDIYMSQILSDDGADLLLIGNPDGTPIKGDLAPAIALFAAAARRGSRGRDKSGGAGRDLVPTDPAELEEWAKKRNKGGKGD